MLAVNLHRAARADFQGRITLIQFDNITSTLSINALGIDNNTAVLPEALAVPLFFLMRY